MNFTDELKDKINEIYLDITPTNDMGLNVDSSLGGATVFSNSWAICHVDELGTMIRELKRMQEAIKKAGIIV